MTWTTLLFCNFLSGILCAILAHKKGKPVLTWFLLAVPLGVLALFVLLALPEDRSREPTQDPNDRSGTGPGHGKRSEP